MMNVIPLTISLMMLGSTSGKQPCSKPDHDCDCSLSTWAWCQNKKMFPHGVNLPKTTLFLSLSSNKLGPILTSKELNRLEPLPLKNLDLSRNQVQLVENKAFSNLKKLTVLSLSYNKISNFTDEIFFGLNNLLYLFANNMQLLYLSKNVFASTPKLQYIDLENNNLTVIGKEFTFLPDLSTLLLANNKISVIQSDSFKSQKFLFHLSLFGNKLFFPIPEWFHIVVRNNGSVEIDGKADDSVRNPNPWICCFNVFRYLELLSLLKRESKIFQQLNIVCSNPIGLAGRPISSLREDEINPASCFKYKQTFSLYHVSQKSSKRDLQSKFIFSNGFDKDINKFHIFGFNNLDVIFLSFIFIVATSLVAGCISCMVMKCKKSEKLQATRNFTFYNYRQIRKQSTRPFRQNPPMYGFTDRSPRSDDAPHCEKNDVFEPERSNSPSLSIIVENDMEKKNSSYFSELDQSEDEPWSIVDRNHGNDPKTKSEFQ